MTDSELSFSDLKRPLGITTSQMESDMDALNLGFSDLKRPLGITTIKSVGGKIVVPGFSDLKRPLGITTYTSYATYELPEGGFSDLKRPLGITTEHRAWAKLGHLRPKKRFNGLSGPLLQRLL